MKKVFVVLLLAMFLIIACGDGGDQKQAADMQKEYAGIKTKIADSREEVKSREAYDKWKAHSKMARESFVTKYAAISGQPHSELVLAGVLIDLEKYDEALTRLDGIGEMDGKVGAAAKFQKARILQARGNMAEALKYFRMADGQIEQNEDYYNALTNFAFEAETAADRKAYTQKFLAADSLPAALQGYVSYMHENLAAIAREEGDLPGSVKILEEAIAKYKSEEKDATSLEFTLKKTKMIGQPAPKLFAKTWLNGKAKSLQKLKGKVVVVDFWATWCGPCRAVIPALVETYRESKNDGLEIIGFTRLYGSYRDDLQNLGEVSPEDEVTHTGEFLERFEIEYPIAIARDTEVFDAFAVRGIPTLFLIDKKGNIVDFKVGSGNEKLLREKIQKLLDS